MQSSYITHPEGYCYLNETNEELNFINLIDYFIKKGFIKDRHIQEQVKKLKSFCQHDKDHKKWHFSFIDYSVYSSKSIHEFDEKTFDEIAKNFETLKEVEQLSKNLIEVLSTKSMKEAMKNLTNEEFKSYLNEYQAREFFDKKEVILRKKISEEQNISMYSAALYREVDALMKPIRQEYFLMPVMKCHTDYKKALKTNLTSVVEHWGEVLNEDGRPKNVETNSATEHFKEATSYAIFCENYSGVGYWFQKSFSLVPLKEARLFESEKDALSEMERHKLKGAIVAVNVKFINITQTIGKIDLSDLEVVVAHQEKEHIEQMDTIESLANKLLALTQNQEKYKTLTQNLNQILAPSETHLTQPKKQKI